MNYWVTALPFLLYLASIDTHLISPLGSRDILTKLARAATSIIILVQTIHPSDSILKSVIPFDYVCYPISLSLTLLLTIMIIVRLARHGRKMRNAVGSGTNGSGLYDTIVATLVESYALYALSFLVYIPLLDTGNPVQLVLSPIFVEAQVRAISHPHDAGAIVFGYRHLVVMTSRSSPHTLSFYELPTGKP